eukprot:TRINITY_DN4916_c0_g1_i1.p1 TRINITY_DN4916_c0_g1~~TRINITY_DN4916_c0_g1_i1.p1  ORF type:complete len:396 (-),score=149.29 TRINITY_DN4916_c0_g1_i1:355-1518(-)
MAAARAFVASLADGPSTHADLKPQLNQLQALHEKKLWHQLTQSLEQLIVSPNFQKADELVRLYEHFIRDFETRLNQLSLAKMLVVISKRIPDIAEAVAFLQNASKRISKDSEKEAYAYAQSHVAFFKLRQNQLDEVKQMTDAISAILESITGIDSVVYSAFYRVMSDYFKARVSPTDFYKNSLLYLTHTPLESIPVHEAQALAFDLGIAALVSTDIYNFGELLASPVLNRLAGTKPEWIVQLLKTINGGQIDEFEAILVRHKTEMDAQPALASNLNLMREKISILALVELVFGRPSRERVLPFKLVAEKTKLRVDEVELLLMKAFSLKLARGEIDEVDQTVTISWIQPRTLDLVQVAKMRDALRDWSANVHNVQTFVQNETHQEIFA